MSALLVRDIMTSPAVVVSPQTPITKIRALMRQHDIRRVPVVNDDKLIGIVSLGDIRGAVPPDANTLSIYELSAMLSKVNAAQIMHEPVVTVPCDAPVIEAAHLILTEHISGLPAMDGRKLVGMLTESDIFRAIVAASCRLLLRRRRAAPVRCLASWSEADDR